MILYCAMGGGLGHISRSLAILSRSAWLSGRTRLMTSSSLAGIAAGVCPCPMDHVAGETVTSKRRYAEFLSGHIKRHRARLLIVDTFPSGIVGEWGWVRPGIPMILVARHIKWKEYTGKTGGVADVAPKHTLAVEPLDGEQKAALGKSGEVSQLDSPITLERQGVGGAKRGVLVVHSGSDEELTELKKVAQERASGAEDVELVSPGRGVYPVERFIRDYSTIISGAGYNMSALASQAPEGVTYILHPFERRYDDQFLRARRIKEGMWSGAGDDGAQKAARWLEERAECYLR